MRKLPKKVPLSKALLASLGIPTIFFPGLILASILGWDWKPDIQRLIQRGGYKQSSQVFPKQAVVTHIYDGDTIEIDNGQTIRMIGINAPDRGEPRWEEAKNYLTDLIDNEKIQLEYDYYQDDQFGRVLAYVWEDCKTSLGCTDGKRLINWLVIKKGYADFVPAYKDRRKLIHEDLLKSAQVR